jgi:hypothetical protein
MSYSSGTLYPGGTLYPSSTDDGGSGGGDTGGSTTQYPSGTLFPSDTTWPGTGIDDVPPPGETSRRIQWSKVEDRTIETGLDRGVLYLRDGSSSPWNGLTAVDVNGGESAVAYYMDGRPYLFVPQPIEFSANLKALTFPDSFSSVMGVVEVADGMYLDSQQSDQFDLSYRTKIGNAVDGTDAGYKIHLIYNATVTPSSLSYGTITTEVNPVEFSWDIQAVPIQIPGYRATAHLVIDTRHMEPSKIAMFEAMLYGSGSSLPRMPTPSELLDTLGFGDVIVITDNGDGTWTAEGSYQNIVVDEASGLFQIKNVDAIDNGDGTYTISSTNV